MSLFFPPYRFFQFPFIFLLLLWIFHPFLFSVGGCAIYFALAYVRLCSCMYTNFRSMSLYFQQLSLFSSCLSFFLKFPFIFPLPLGVFIHFLSFGGILLCTRVLPINSTHFGRVARFTWTQAHFMYAPVRGCAIYFALGYVRLCSCMYTNFRSMSLYFQ